jgi:tetratricopeptide (TPR) repeat protein
MSVALSCHAAGRDLPLLRKGAQLSLSPEQQHWQTRLETAQAALSAASTWLERCHAHLQIGEALHELDQFDAALVAFAQAESLARLHYQPRLISEAISGKVRVAGGKSQFGEVLKAAKESVRWAEQANDPSTLAKAMYWLGNTEFYLGNLSTARTHLELSLELVKTLGDPLRLAATLTLLGRLEGQAGRQKRRIELLQSALEINQAHNYQKGIAVCLTGLSWSTLLDGQFAESEAYTLQGLKILQQQGSQWMIANSLLNLAHAQTAQGKLENAKKHLLEALEIAHKVNSVNLLLEFLVAAARTESNKAVARHWVRIAVMHPNSTSETRNFAAPDVEKLEVVLKPVEAEALYKILPEVKKRLEQGE